jgi:hypothetical protein
MCNRMGHSGYSFVLLVVKPTQSQSQPQPQPLFSASYTRAAGHLGSRSRGSLVGQQQSPLTHNKWHDRLRLLAQPKAEFKESSYE